MSNQITVNGPSFQLIIFPSGQFEGLPGGNLEAHLISANTSFGFNNNPHTFDLQFITVGPMPFHGASGQLPPIEHPLQMDILNFYINGRITHSDWSTSSAGTLFRVQVEDDRRSLDKLKIYTDDIGDINPSGIVSVARAYRINNPLLDSQNNPNTATIFEYEKILDLGATYPQILSAIQLAIDENDTTISLSQIPSVSDIEANIGGDVNALRFKFEEYTPLGEVITKVCDDSAYDWYWNMATDQVHLVNRKSAFTIDENRVFTILSQF